MRLNYIPKSQAGDTVRELVFVGYWKLGELMVRPDGVTFHGTNRHTSNAAMKFKSREAFEAALSEYVA